NSLQAVLKRKRPPEVSGKPFVPLLWRAAADRSRSALVAVDIVDCILDGGDLLSRIVRDLDAELFFERHYQLDDVLHPVGGLAHVDFPPFRFWVALAAGEAVGKRSRRAEICPLTPQDERRP